MQIPGFVSEMVGIEEQVLALLSDWAGDVEIHPRAASAVGRFQQMVQENLTSLRGRLSALPAGEPSQPRFLLPLPTSREPADATQGRVVRALHTWHTAFSHVAVCYAILHAVAHRLYDSEGEGNTADLAEAHLRRYTGAVQEIEQLISDVVIADLDSTGHQCRCQCPSCALGVCLCAPHGTITVNKAWRETSPAPFGPGVEVRAPRSGSPAAQVGLSKGDRIVAADGQQLPTDLDAPVLQAAVRAHEPGEAITLQVLQDNGETSQIQVTRSY